MAFFGKEYTIDRHENIEDFLKAAGLPEERSKAFASFKTTQKIEKNGDSYLLILSTPQGKRERKFKSGVEFDDPRQNGIIAKTKIVIDGNTVIQTIKTDKNVTTIKGEYNGDEMVATFTIDKWDGAAKAYYKAN